MPICSDIILKHNAVLNTSLFEYWDMKKFTEKFKLKIIRFKDDEMEFDLIGINPAIVNALRRILISEVPSMAFEKIFIYNNTSIIQDEILAHRLGLIPLAADASLFEFRQKDDTFGSAQDTLQFELKIKCSRNPNNEDSALPNDMYKNNNVYSKHLKWIPMGGQSEIFKPAQVGPINDDILIAKLRPGHEIDIKLHAVKGIGIDHAKFSPVATASYRLMPQIKLLRRIENDQAYLLQSTFSPGVIGIEEINGIQTAKVLDPRYDSGSRNCFRYDELKDALQITRKRDHFIFTIESVGGQKPNILFIEALKILKKRCRTYLEEFNKK